VSPLILVVVFWISGRGIWIIAHLNLICIQESESKCSTYHHFAPFDQEGPGHTCDLSNAYEIHDEQHVLFHCTHPHMVSQDLCAPTSFRSFQQCVCFSGPGKKLYFFLHALIVSYQQAAVALLNWRLFVNPHCNPPCKLRYAPRTGLSQVQLCNLTSPTTLAIRVISRTLCSPIGNLQINKESELW